MLSPSVIRAREIVKDIRSGMSDAELLAKHNLSCAELDEVLKQLVERNVLSRIELDNRRKSDEQSPHVIDFRETERRKPAFDIPVYEAGIPNTRGTLFDISTKGAGISGIPSFVGETKSLQVGAEFGEFASFAIQAQCRWTKHATEPQDTFRAGYQITSISYDAFRRLQRLIEACSAPARAGISWDRGDHGRRASWTGPDFDKL